MIFPEFSTYYQPIVMKFYKHYHLLKTTLTNMYSLEVKKNVTLYKPINVVSEFYLIMTHGITSETSSKIFGVVAA